MRFIIKLRRVGLCRKLKWDRHRDISSKSHSIAVATAIEVARILPDVLLNGCRVEPHHGADVLFFREHILAAYIQLQAELMP